MTDHPIGVRARLDQLTADSEDDARLLGAAQADETSEGYYYLTLRQWQRDDPTLSTLSLRYAYLTKGDGGDGWLDSGVNMRVDTDSVSDLLGLLAQMFAAGQARQGDTDTEAWLSGLGE
ncbi:putative protein 32 [Haloarcula hispanica icosahedral virus 2]|uniref:Uncharacterized protein n=1 Tax=Haloarcula hispanica icosahedral virus 2 TaxID=1154689 RepID=H9AZY8_9VIRU|nr:putative protein 32 [Haloarcula hispanica icosahedral virus 2]AFD02313.1 putative protein 32 [Haloarcula hispanica icosahedral virus 2]